MLLHDVTSASTHPLATKDLVRWFRNAVNIIFDRSKWQRSPSLAVKHLVRRVLNTSQTPLHLVFARPRSSPSLAVKHLVRRLWTILAILRLQVASREALCGNTVQVDLTTWTAYGLDRAHIAAHVRSSAEFGFLVENNRSASKREPHLGLWIMLEIKSNLTVASLRTMSKHCTHT